MFEVVGTALIGLAQPFFQCTPPLLSATWFGNKERALSTAVCLNANQLGIATSFVLGGAMLTGRAGGSSMRSLDEYLVLLTGRTPTNPRACDGTNASVQFCVH